MMKVEQKRSECIMVLGALLVAGAVGFLGGCASEKIWSKPGLHQTEFDRDFAKCSREASSTTSSLALSADFNNSLDLERGLDRSMTRDALIKKCMYSLGYKLESR
jgi:hypothetical protein